MFNFKIKTNFLSGHFISVINFDLARYKYRENEKNDFSHYKSTKKLSGFVPVHWVTLIKHNDLNLYYNTIKILGFVGR